MTKMYWYGIKDSCCKNKNIRFYEVVCIPKTGRCEQLGQCETCKRVFILKNDNDVFWFTGLLINGMTNIIDHIKKSVVYK